MVLTDSLKRVPRWAWYTSAGVAIGGAAIYAFRNRDTPAEDEPSSDAAVTGYPDQFGASPMGVPGIVVPDINIPEGSAGESGWMELHNTYLSGLQTMLDTLTNRPVIEPSPSEPVPVQVTITPTGGGAASEPRNGVVAVAPPASQARPQPACCKWGGHPLSWWRNPNHNRRNGKWRWPGGGGFTHSRAFEGHKACDTGSHSRQC